VVKNVSGFDLHRLQVGAFGALGITVEAHFKVSPRPAVVAALLIGQPTLAAALSALLRVRESALRPVALEALDAGAMAACRTLVPELPGGPGSPRTEAVAVVGIEGSRAALDRHLGDLAALRAEARISTVLEGGACDRLWQALRDAPARSADQVTARVAAKPHDLPALLAEIAAAGPDLEAVTAQGGLGIARLRFSASLTAPTIAATVRRWDEAARARRGYAVVESAPLTLPERSLLPFRTGPVSPLERRIKQAFDPLHLLNPGRAPL
jgi:FAD/FMN-containing dehydrogenase